MGGRLKRPGLLRRRPGDTKGMSKGLARVLRRHQSTADERFGLRLGAGLTGTFVAAVTFALLLLLVRAGWAPLRNLDMGAAETTVGQSRPRRAARA